MVPEPGDALAGHVTGGLSGGMARLFVATEELVPVTHPQPLVADRSAPGAARYEDLAVFPLGA